MIDLILIALLIAVLAWREVQILIDRGSWKDWDYHKLFWYTDWQGKWKNWDSFHVSNGLATLIIIYLIKGYLPEALYVFCQPLTDILHTIAYWLIWMQIRNLFMHIIFKRRK